MTDNTDLKHSGRAATNSYGDGYQVALIAEDLVDALEEAEAERDALRLAIDRVLDLTSSIGPEATRILREATGMEASTE